MKKYINSYIYKKLNKKVINNMYGQCIYNKAIIALFNICPLLENFYIFLFNYILQNIFSTNIKIIFIMKNNNDYVFVTNGNSCITFSFEKYTQIFPYIWIDL